MKEIETSSASTQTAEPEMMIDTSRMNEGQREALEVTEAARETKVENPSFAGQLFMGTFVPDPLTPFPFQNDKEREIGDKLVESLATYLKDHLDPEEVDETRTIPPDVIDELVRQGVFAMKIPKEYDGLGLTQVNYNRVMMMLTSASRAGTARSPAVDSTRC